MYCRFRECSRQTFPVPRRKRAILWLPDNEPDKKMWKLNRNETVQIFSRQHFKWDETRFSFERDILAKFVPTGSDHATIVSRRESNGEYDTRNFLPIMDPGGLDEIYVSNASSCYRVSIFVEIFSLNIFKLVFWTRAYTGNTFTDALRRPIWVAIQIIRIVPYRIMYELTKHDCGTWPWSRSVQILECNFSALRE